MIPPSKAPSLCGGGFAFAADGDLLSEDAVREPPLLPGTTRCFPRGLAGIPIGNQSIFSFSLISFIIAIFSV